MQKGNYHWRLVFAHKHKHTLTKTATSAIKTKIGQNVDENNNIDDVGGKLTRLAFGKAMALSRMQQM